ncbi:MAG: hypothetical protein KatS3mg129_1881 [Leptospiraceae bacterium]|nr:MAG: hypothetical protein KatS3mg129_1881 [Leptospiraceae bacterium]
MKNKFFIFYVTVIYFFLYFISCKEINVPDLYPDIQDTSFFKTSNFIEEVCISIKSNMDIDRNDFIKTYSISRLFYSYIKNQSGSIRELLNKGILKKFLYDRINVKFQQNHCLNKIEIFITNYEFKWLPPQEFIQNPVPIRKGEFLADFSANYIIKYKNQKINKNYKNNIILNLLPKEEYNSIEIAIAQILRSFIDELYKEFWTIKLKNN